MMKTTDQCNPGALDCTAGARGPVRLDEEEDEGVAVPQSDAIEAKRSLTVYPLP